MSQNILIADDDSGVLSALRLLLKSEGFSPVSVNHPEQALSALRRQEFSLVLMDLNYSLDTTSGDEGLKLIKAIRELDDWIPIVVMTGWGTIEVAVDTMKNGANDFIQKPWENDRLLSIVKNQIKLSETQKRSQKLSRQNQLLEEEIHPNISIVAESDAIKGVLETLKQVARSDASVLLTGENGTGKSLFARYIHEFSQRKEMTLVPVNMGAVTESLFESEMFGHEKGAFTDAKTSRIGRFELADKGTLFLDEIANTPHSQQGKLLRVLEDSQFEKVGSSKTQTVDIRLITATNSDLDVAVREGKFREDLLYRINTITVEIPPLRDRREDIIPLANAFLSKVAKKYSQPVLSIEADAESALLSYPWPGNVRELGHVMERAQILCQSSTINSRDLGLNGYVAQKISPPQPPQQEEKVAENIGSEVKHDLKSINEIESEIIRQRLSHFDGDAKKAASSLGMSRSTFYRKLDKLKA